MKTGSSRAQRSPARTRRTAHGNATVRWPVVAAGLALTLTAATTAPAAAAGTVVPDTVGDAWRPIDITALGLDNGKQAVTVRLGFRDVDRTRFGRIRVQLDVGRPLRYGYFILLRRRADGSWVRRLMWEPMYSEYSGNDIACPRLRLTWAENQARVRLPRGCMVKRYDERVRASASTENRAHNAGDSVPDGALFTDWVRRG